MKLVANQREIKVNKSATDKTNLYTVNNLEALDEAAFLLQSKAGFKLYMYIAKNQHNYTFALSSKDFCGWSGCGMTAYRAAFQELIEQGYLIPKEDNTQTKYIFYDKSQKEIEEEIIIEYPKEKIEEVNNINNYFRM